MEHEKKHCSVCQVTGRHYKVRDGHCVWKCVCEKDRKKGDRVCKCSQVSMYVYDIHTITCFCKREAESVI